MIDFYAQIGEPRYPALRLQKSLVTQRTSEIYLPIPVNILARDSRIFREVLVESPGVWGYLTLLDFSGSVFPWGWHGWPSWTVSYVFLGRS